MHYELPHVHLYIVDCCFCYKYLIVFYPHYTPAFFTISSNGVPVVPSAESAAFCDW